MSAAIAAVSMTDERYSFVAGNKYFVVGQVAISASPATYTQGGIAMNMFIPLLKATMTPIFVIIQGQSGYVYIYIPGADASAGLLKILTGAAAQSALTELTNGANIPAGVSGDTITFLAIFNGMQ